jgi:hypothetical protein
MVDFVKSVSPSSDVVKRWLYHHSLLITTVFTDLLCTIRAGMAFEWDMYDTVHTASNVVVIQYGFHVIMVMMCVSSNVYGIVLCMMNYYWREYGDAGIDMVMSVNVDVGTMKSSLERWRCGDIECYVLSAELDGLLLL